MLLGTATAFPTDTLAGWYDLPDMRGSDVPYSSRHGGYQGQRLVNGRQITWNFKTKGTKLPGFPAAISQLRLITAPAEAPIEEPLVIRVDGTALRCMARVAKRAIPTDHAYALGYTAGAIVWETSDPRLYSMAETVYSTALPVASTGGVDFSSGGVDFSSGGVDFGSGQQGGVITAVQNGHVPMWPIIEIDGPITGPGVTFPDLGRQLLFSGSWSVVSGQTIVIDTYNRTAQIAGVSVSQRLQVRQWTSLVPGSTRVLFSAAAYDPAPRMRVRVRDAYQ